MKMVGGMKGFKVWSWLVAGEKELGEEERRERSRLKKKLLGNHCSTEPEGCGSLETQRRIVELG